MTRMSATNYQTNVDQFTSSASFTAVNGLNAVVMIGGQNKNGVQHTETSLTGGNRDVIVSVTSEDGTVVQAYTITISKFEQLAVATVTGVSPAKVGATRTLSLSFSAGTAPYTYQWTKNGGNMLEATASTLTIVSVNEGDEATYACLISNSAGTATASGFFLNVEDEDRALDGLATNVGSFNEPFSASTTAYTITVLYETDTATVTPSLPAGSKATIKVDGTSVASDVASGSKALTVGENVFSVVVSAENTDLTTTYQVTITRRPFGTFSFLQVFPVAPFLCSFCSFLPHPSFLSPSLSLSLPPPL